MTKPRFLHSPNPTPERDALRRAAEHAGYHAVEAPYRVDLAPQPGDVLYGGALWAEVVASHLGLNLLETPLDWLANAPEELTGRTIHLTTGEKLNHWSQPHCRRDGVARFIKPLDKEGPDAGLYGGWSVRFPKVPDDALFLTQSPLELSLEVRAFVLDGLVEASSIYALHGRPLFTPVPDGEDYDDIVELASAVYSLGTSARATVIDFALTREDRWIVLEQNAPWCSAIYAANPDCAFGVVEESVTYQNSKFARTRVEMV